MRRDAAVAALHAQDFLKGDAGRYWVAISLREAETVRAAMHVARDGGAPLIPGSRGTPAIALRVLGGASSQTLLEALGPSPAAGNGGGGGVGGGGCGSSMGEAGARAKPRRVNAGLAVRFVQRVRPVRSKPVVSP